MHERRNPIGTLQIDLGAQRRLALQDVKKSVLTLLGVWIAYFLVINAFIQQLDSITVPLVGLPLGVLLVIQGGALLFLATLYVLARLLGTSEA